MNIPQGYKQTEFGPIPLDWELCTFKDVLATFSSGATPYRGIPEYYNGDVRWISSGELNYNHIYDTLEHISQQAVRNTNLRIHKPGTFLMAITGLEAEGTRGRCAFVGAPSATNQSCLAINGTDKMCAEYLFWFYRMWGQYLAFKYCQGTKQQSYTADIVKKLPIYGPKDITEQKAIAEALSDVDGLIAALDKKIAKKRLLKQGAMQQLLTGKKRLPGFTDEWETIRLGDWATMNSGGTPTSSVPEYYNGHIPFLSISDITEAGKYINKTEKTITEKGLNNSSARMFPAGTIMYAMYASLGKCSIANIELSCSQAILGITPKCRITPEYLYYYLSFIEEDVKDMGQTGTQSNLSKQIVQDFMVKLPSDIKEQQAIATILSDMDKEIADLEAQRDKYRLLKSGMMQKLLTGQIRLVKQQAKIIPLGVEVPVVREIPVATHIIAGHIVNRSHKSRGWGRTKLQKSLHLIGYCAQLNLGNEYIRNTAGPDDQQLMNYIDQKFRQYRHVNKVCEKLPDGKTHYSYTPTPMIQDVEMAYEKYPKELREQIDALIDKLNTLDLAGAEILSTLYAVWNNRIIKQEQITDDLLIADFYAWSTHKADFEEARVRKALNYMRDNNIIPVGWGKYIDKR
ncbi:MAG: restriction endonuclease subunit S [Rikenellaceae bacterium]|nr:restriction endonuclease subunit S [Rikenellaceae bacterium]